MRPSRAAILFGSTCTHTWQKKKGMKIDGDSQPLCVSTTLMMNHWRITAPLKRRDFPFSPQKNSEDAYFLADNLLFYINAGFFHKYLVFNLGIEVILTELGMKYFRHIYIFLAQNLIWRRLNQSTPLYI